MLFTLAMRFLLLGRIKYLDIFVKIIGPLDKLWSISIETFSKKLNMQALEMDKPSDLNEDY